MLSQRACAFQALDNSCAELKRPRPFNIQRTAITSPETCVGRRLLHANCHSFRVGSAFRSHGDSQTRVNHLVGGTVIRQHNVITSRPMVDCSRILTATHPEIRRTHRHWCGFNLCLSHFSSP